MKLTDLINERNRLDAAFPKQQGGYCDINIFTLEEELEQYGISWLEKILKDPTNNQPFVEEVENRCKGFMRQQPAQRHARARPNQRALRQSAVVRLVMLQSEVGNVVAECEEKMVIAIVPRPKELA